MQNDNQNSANPWADFEPVSNTMHPNINTVDRRVISPPVTPPQRNIGYTPEVNSNNHNPISTNSTQANSQNNHYGTGDGSTQGDIPKTVSAQYERQNTATRNSSGFDEDPLFSTGLSNSNPIYGPQPSPNGPGSTPNAGTPYNKEVNGFDSIAWPGESSGVEASPASLRVEAMKPLTPNTDRAPGSSLGEDHLEQSKMNSIVSSSLNHPQPDSVIEDIKPKRRKSKSKLKIVTITILTLAIVAGALFFLFRAKFSNKVNNESLNIQQKTTQEIIKLAQENKPQEIINKYIRESNKANFPTDQFKFNVQTFSEASIGEASYTSENTGKVIVEPDTTSSDMQVYIYTTNYKGYRGKIYIRVDLFKNASDGVWYLYAFSYNSNELKPDIVNN